VIPITRQVGLAMSRMMINFMLISLKAPATVSIRLKQQPSQGSLHTAYRHLACDTVYNWMKVVVSCGTYYLRILLRMDAFPTTPDAISCT
jgi:hypothetical protein